MKYIIDVLFVVSVLVLLIAFILLLGGILFNLSHPGKKGMGEGELVMLGLIIVGTYGLFSVFKFLIKHGKRE